MNKSESIKELASALAAAQSEFTPVPLNAVNPFLKNKYADLSSVIESAKPILAKHGLSIAQLVENEQGIGVTTILMHTSGEWLSSMLSLPLGDERGKSLAQVAGSIITYIRRYTYGAILGLYTGDDDDGSAGAKREKSESAVKSVQATQSKNSDPTEGETSEAQKKFNALGLPDFKRNALLQGAGGDYTTALSMYENSLTAGKKKA